MYYGKHQVETICEDDFDFFCTHPDAPTTLALKLYRRIEISLRHRETECQRIQSDCQCPMLRYRKATTEDYSELTNNNIQPVMPLSLKLHYTKLFKLLLIRILLLMKFKVFTFSILLLAIMTSCSNHDEPNYPVFMQPASITTDDINGGTQTFEYNEHGKIISWTQDYSENESIIARYSYPDDNTIKIETKELSYDTRTYWTETIQLLNGRASRSEGTFIIKQADVVQIQKTYRLEFAYTPDNYLNVVRHSEVMGIGENVSADNWEKSWNWENYLIWENGNLKEYQDFFGKSVVYETTKYEYSSDDVVHPVIIPVVINSLHHGPLLMQGVFGSNSNNLLESSSVFDKDGNLNLTRHYTYEFNDAALIDQYVETIAINTAFSNSISYKVNWTDK